MGHIHTEAGHHDATVSAYIIRMQDDEPLCLVHMHRKYQRLIQPGGHIELSETPWSALEHELREETGYTLDELSILQPSGARIMLNDTAVTHPLPLLMNTHPVKDGHFHSDQGYGFVARTEPLEKPIEGESDDLRWLTLQELKTAVDDGIAYENVYTVFKAIVTYYLQEYEWVPATDFSTADPLVRSSSDYR